jgi:hypothetical protein
VKEVEIHNCDKNWTKTISRKLLIMKDEMMPTANLRDWVEREREREPFRSEGRIHSKTWWWRRRMDGEISRFFLNAIDYTTYGSYYF